MDNSTNLLLVFLELEFRGELNDCSLFSHYVGQLFSIWIHNKFT